MVCKYRGLEPRTFGRESAPIYSAPLSCNSICYLMIPCVQQQHAITNSIQVGFPVQPVIPLCFYQKAYVIESNGFVSHLCHRSWTVGRDTPPWPGQLGPGLLWRRRALSVSGQSGSGLSSGSRRENNRTDIRLNHRRRLVGHFLLTR